MENLSLALIFWYGILHAFAPDHLSAIASFSIGKNKFKTMAITIVFALGHGITLLVFAKILQSFYISDEIMKYGDSISYLVIIFMGLYLLYMVIFDKIQLSKHYHQNKEHIHIYFGDSHKHNQKDIKSALSIGALMGIGGVRGMLVSISAINNDSVNFIMVLSFTLGVMLVFMLFGTIILYINKNLLNTKKNIRIGFSILGVLSLIVGFSMLEV